MHSKECPFLGYSATHEGYKCLESNGRMFISKDVLFNECKLPYSTMFPSSKSTRVLVPSGLSSGSHVPISSFYPSHPTQIPVSHASISSSQSISTRASLTSSRAAPSQPSHSPTDLLGSNTYMLSNSLLLTFHSPSGSSLIQPLVPSNFASESSPLVSEDTNSHSSSTTISLPAPPIQPLNTHAMTTRAKNGIVQPRYNLLFLSLILNHHLTRRI